MGDESKLLSAVVECLEKKQYVPEVSLEDVSTEMLKDLLDSKNADLTMIGLYILSLRKEKDALGSLLDSPNSNRNIARFLLAETPKEEIEQKIDNSMFKTSLFSENFNSLKSRQVAPLEAVSQGSQVNKMTIIIHGTWAATSEWWQKGGNFWEYVNGITGDVYAGDTPFSWSGANKHEDRVKGAHELMEWVSKNPTAELDIITHSHGGNVSLLASQLGLKINKLILLGTPIRLEYLPNLNNVKVLHNIFSTGDSVQTPAGTLPNRRAEGRTLGDTLRVLNYRAADNGQGKNPGHSQLHEPDTWQASDLEGILH